MNDEQAIQKLISEFAYYGSTREWARQAATFTETGYWEVAGTEFKLVGHQAIAAGLPAILAETDMCVQIAAPAIVEVTGASATARTIVREIMRMTDRDEAVDLQGCYDDLLEKTGQGWRFARRTFSTWAMLPLALLPHDRGQMTL